MKLIVAHQILIASAIVLALLFGARALAMYLRGEGGGQLGLAILSAVVAVALAVYLKSVREKWLAEKKSG